MPTNPTLLFPFPIGAAGDGKCVVCDSYVRPCTLVRICDECNYGSFEVSTPSSDSGDGTCVSLSKESVPSQLEDCCCVLASLKITARISLRRFVGMFGDVAVKCMDLNTNLSRPQPAVDQPHERNAKPDSFSIPATNTQTRFARKPSARLVLACRSAFGLLNFIEPSLTLVGVVSCRPPFYRFSGPVHHLRRPRHLGRVLLPRVHAAGEGPRRVS